MYLIEGKGCTVGNRNATDIVQKNRKSYQKDVLLGMSHMSRENQLIKEIYTKSRYSTKKNLLTRSDIPVFSGSPISIRSTSTYAESM